jgi:hypothetical protein
MATNQQVYDPVVYRSGSRLGAQPGAIFSSNMPHRAPLLCYIAGIECPITAATVSYGVWKIPEASISMFPDPKLQRFGAQDRVPVVLFYLDEYIDPKRPTWRMLFEGEIVGWGYQNTSAGRAINFQCLMDIAVWTQLFLFYMTNVDTIASGVLTARQSAEQINQAAAVFPYSLFRKGLITQGDTGYITRPFDLAYNVVRGLIMDTAPADKKCIPAVNFFSRWTRRQQFHNKWVALPFLDEQSDAKGNTLTSQSPGIFPVLRAAQSDQAVKAIEQQAWPSLSGGSIYTTLKQILDTVYMEVAMLPTPAAVGTYTNGSIFGKPQLVTPKQTGLFMPESFFQPGAHDAGLIDPKKPIRLTNYFVKPQMFFGLPPVCNVIFPSMTPDIQYSENFATQPTRLYFEDSALPDLTGKEAKPQTKEFFIKALARAYPPAADNRYQAKVLGKTPNETGKNVLIWPEEFFKGPVTARYPAPPWLMYFASQNQGAGIPAGKGTAAPTTKSVSPTEGSSNSDQDLYVLYAQYEYFKQCYSQRGGAVTCAFQPYLVPGFPMMVFDDFQAKMHIIGYLMNVTQQFTSQSVVTSANFSYARTIYEFFQDIANEMDKPALEARSGLATAAAPPEPIPEIRDIIQHFDRADQLYQALFMRRPETPTKPAVFQYRDILAFVKSDGTLEDIEIEGINEETIKTRQTQYDEARKVLDAFLSDGTKQAAIRASGEKVKGGKIDTTELRKAVETARLTLTVAEDLTATIVQSAIANIDSELARMKTPSNYLHHNLSANRDIAPKPGYEPYFDSYDAAMQYCARPICTLEEYIYFINGMREGAIDDVNYDDGSAVTSARYYKRIRKLKGATDKDKASDEEQGLQGKSPTAVSSTFPVLRAEWDKVLLAYRARIYASLKVSR